MIIIMLCICYDISNILLMSFGDMLILNCVNVIIQKQKEEEQEPSPKSTRIKCTTDQGGIIFFTSLQDFFHH